MSGHSPYYRQLDAFRCLAVILVLLAHWTAADWLIQMRMANFGIDLFFVLSSFLITRILLTSKEAQENGSRTLGQSFKTFYLRRTLRIFPAYYVVLILTFLFTPSTRPSFVWNAAYLSNFYIMGLDQWPGTVSHYWSLAVEEQFYLMWPLVIFLIPRTYLLRVMGAIVVIAILWRAYWYVQATSLITLKIFTPLCFDAFGLGSMLAYLSKYHEEWLRRLLNRSGLGWTIFGLFGLIAVSPYWTAWGGFEGVVFHRTLGSLLSFFWLGKAYFGYTGGWKGILEWKPILFIGQISYAIYLFHNFIPGFFLGVKYSENEWLMVPLYFVGVVVISTASRYLIEQPFNRLKRRFHY
ncbi:MAG: acyltransferase [Bacteroidota bacterium]